MWLRTGGHGGTASWVYSETAQKFHGAAKIKFLP
jgi:hypothetical protein